MDDSFDVPSLPRGGRGRPPRASGPPRDAPAGTKATGGGSPFPSWPRAMPLEWAAAYVGLAPSTWLREVREGRAPKPVRLTSGRAAWYLEHLDAWLDDRAAGREDEGSDWDKAFGR